MPNNSALAGIGEHLAFQTRHLRNFSGINAHLTGDAFTCQWAAGGRRQPKSAERDLGDSYLTDRMLNISCGRVPLEDQPSMRAAHRNMIPRGSNWTMQSSSAAKKEIRSEERARVGISAEIFDPESDNKFYCLILDATREGCRIFCDNINELPDVVCLQPERIGKPIKASIRWRKDLTAGLKLDWADTMFT